MWPSYFFLFNDYVQILDRAVCAAAFYEMWANLFPVASAAAQRPRNETVCVAYWGSINPTTGKQTKKKTRKYQKLPVSPIKELNVAFHWTNMNETCFKLMDESGFTERKIKRNNACLLLLDSQIITTCVRLQLA